MNRGISILMYHQVGRFRPMKSHRSTYCHHRRFKAQMTLLKLLGYRVLDFDSMLATLRGEREVPPRAVVLTFDDGYENFREYAHPVLHRLRLPSMVYLLAGYLGDSARWFASDGRDTPPLMDAATVSTLARQGVSFGSHGINHLKLADQPSEVIEREVHESRELLERATGLQIRDFCFPYGSHDRRCLQAVRSAGYRSAVTCVRGSAYPGEDLFQLPRKAISFGDSLAGFLWKIHVKNRRKHPPL